MSRWRVVVGHLWLFTAAFVGVWILGQIGLGNGPALAVTLTNWFNMLYSCVTATIALY